MRIVVVALVAVIATFALGASATTRAGCGILDKLFNPSTPEGEESAPYTIEGDTVYFGSYPQTKVTDTDLITTLNSLAGTLPTSENSQNWTSYGYYISGSEQNYMWYIDVLSGTEKYRGVYFISYRPNKTNYPSTGNSYVDNNGYAKYTVYWFKYEPISWTILDESKGLILCDMIIDSQHYDTISNNYENSDIRAWLNNNFYNQAFTTAQKGIIKTTTVNNSERSTNVNSNAIYFNGGKNPYACNDTQDKVFLLSIQEITNSAYGFSESYAGFDIVRRKKTTDYAKSQGCYTYSGGSYDGNGDWWLRSPNYFDSDCSWTSSIYGDAFINSEINNADNGVVPALQIQL